MLPQQAEPVVDRYLSRVDRALPGALEGFYLVGSIALGGFRPGRSDIDFVALVPKNLPPGALRTLRGIHKRTYASELFRWASSRVAWPLACNGIFVSREVLARPPSRLLPVASQTAERFELGSGFDANPVTWCVLSRDGVALRGPSPAELDIHLDGTELRRWTATNLELYWRRWALTIAGRGPAARLACVRELDGRRLAARGVLGVARMHATITTGQVISKERAGEYALDSFPAEWHPVVRTALSYWRAEPGSRFLAPWRLRNEIASFVLHVTDLGRREAVAREIL